MSILTFTCIFRYKICLKTQNQCRITYALFKQKYTLYSSIQSVRPCLVCSYGIKPMHVGASISIGLRVMVCQVGCSSFLMLCWGSPKHFIARLQFISHFLAISTSSSTLATITTGNPVNQFEFKVDFPSVVSLESHGWYWMKGDWTPYKRIHWISDVTDQVFNLTKMCQDIYFKWAKLPSGVRLEHFLSTRSILSHIALCFTLFLLRSMLRPMFSKDKFFGLQHFIKTQCYYAPLQTHISLCSNDQYIFGVWPHFLINGHGRYSFGTSTKM